MFTKIPIGNLDRSDWLRLRKTGIGGSDAGAICGLNPYSSQMSVFRDKTCEIEEEQEDNESIRQGHDLEEYVAQRFMEATGLKVRKSNFMYRSMINSYSKKAYPWDNACIESFHALIKREWLNRFKIFDYRHAYKLVFEYIETFYNTVRIHSHCGYVSPDQYEKEYLTQMAMKMQLAV